VIPALCPTISRKPRSVRSVIAFENSEAIVSSSTLERFGPVRWREATELPGFLLQESGALFTPTQAKWGTVRSNRGDKKCY
jgi:hypothetical protein